MSRSDSSEKEVVLEVTGLHKRFGDLEVLKGIDLTVHRGEVVVLLGPSGSGKTTVLRSLNGLETPDAGVLRVPGAVEIDFAHALPDPVRFRLRDQSAMVFQQHQLFAHKTVLQNVVEGPVQVQKVPRDQAVAEARALLARVGLAAKEDAYPHQLSGGQQQRVGIVRALALKPRLILFDEPTSSLDPELVGEVLGVIRGLAAEGWTMVIVTHELGFARQVADQVIFFDGGVVVEQGPPESVLDDPQQPRTRQFLERMLHR
ncbi:MAG: amino acid ABC transporter ATP-binding protein [Nocardioides sp.]|uniref:amino acid ABC transporter ATP-binding protein n=1 Tax=Nocardioides sp. TaxID=35761 RepID=UPI0039E71B90